MSGVPATPTDASPRALPPYSDWWRGPMAGASRSSRLVMLSHPGLRSALSLPAWIRNGLPSFEGAHRTRCEGTLDCWRSSTSIAAAFPADIGRARLASFGLPAPCAPKGVLHSCSFGGGEAPAAVVLGGCRSPTAIRAGYAPQSCYSLRLRTWSGRRAPLRVGRTSLLQPEPNK